MTLESKVENPPGTAAVEWETIAKPLVISVKNVLFATDFSASSAAALPYAVAICRRFGSTLHSVHVVSDSSLLMMTGGVDYVSMGTLYDDAHVEAKQKLERLVAGLEGIPRLNYVRHGHVWKNLAAIIESNQIDLIVLGTHGRTGLGKLLLGSVAEDILRHANCPVLTVGPRVSGHAKLPNFESCGHDLVPPELELRQILFATNFSDNAKLEVQEAVALAQEFHSRLTLVHVIEDYTQMGRQAGPMEEGIRNLQALIPANAALPYPPETVLEFGSAAERVLKVAADVDADMILLGAHAYQDIGSTHLPWSSAHHVIAHAHCPVLTIRE
jgi:nucleotide-binding universal stress UspA family protein